MQKIATNQDAIKQHKKDVIWQIWIPVGSGFVAIVILGVLSALSLQTGTDAAARWGHVATIWLLLPVFVIGLITFVILGGLVALVIAAIGAVEECAPLLQHYAGLIASRFDMIANKAVSPVIQTRSVESIWQRFWISIRIILLGGMKD